ncbi:MAG: hypothetical protein AAF928_20315 [Myxococcota bacterium]
MADAAEPSGPSGEDDAGEAPGGTSSLAGPSLPDPSLGVGLFVVGLLVMASGGATTQHYVFNVGEALLLLGAVVFLVRVAIARHRQDPWDWKRAAQKLIGR